MLTTFLESIARNIVRPHDDALIITLEASNCEVPRIIIDNGSSVNVIFRSNLKRMNIDESSIERESTELTGFNNVTTHSMGTIKLPVQAKGMKKLFDLVILNCPSIQHDLGKTIDTRFEGCSIDLPSVHSLPDTRQNLINKRLA